MKYGRIDYDGTDPKTVIPEDEPVFLLRGQDKSAPETLRFYARTHKANEGNKDVIESVLKQADEMEAWQATNKRKLADLPVVKPAQSEKTVAPSVETEKDKL
jgi:hypothetical protein